MTDEELERLEGLAEVAREGTIIGSQTTRERFEAITEVCQKAPALVAEVRRLRGLVEAAYREGHMDRALIESGDALYRPCDWADSYASRELGGAK